MKIKGISKKLKTDLPALFLCLKDKETPFVCKLLAAIIVSYALSPIDLIPDFIPVLGYLDDLIILPALIALTIHFMPKQVWNKNLELATKIWENGIPKKWYYALPIIIIWILIILLLIKAIWF